MWQHFESHLESLLLYCLSLLICKCRAATTAMGSRSREEEMRMWKKQFFCWLICIKWISKVRSCVLLCVMPQKNITSTQAIAHFLHFQSLATRRSRWHEGPSAIVINVQISLDNTTGKMVQFVWCMTIWRRDFFQLFFIVLHRRPHMYDVDSRKSVLNCSFALKMLNNKTTCRKFVQDILCTEFERKNIFRCLKLWWIASCSSLEMRALFDFPQHRACMDT